jgi:hypothetical protein
MATVINSYNGNGLTLGAYVDGILTQNNEAGGVPSAPHSNFWDTLDHAGFTTGNVPGVSFGPSPPYPILDLKTPTNSNFVLALQGVGPLFDNNTGAFGQMPGNANPPSMPYFTTAQIQPIHRLDHERLPQSRRHVRAIGRIVPGTSRWRAV